MKRLFIDSSVLFSAVYSPRGNARKIILMIVQGEVSGVISKLVIDETKRNLLEKGPEQFSDLETLIDNIPFEFTRPAKRQVLAAAKHVDLKDAPIVAAAKRAEVDLLMTGDKKHLLGKPAIAKYLGAEIVTLTEAIKRLEENN